MASCAIDRLKISILFTILRLNLSPEQMVLLEMLDRLISALWHTEI
jgi:hypothetical protein